MSDVTPRPFKVWSADRTLRKALVAKSLNEIILKGKEKLGYGDVNVIVHLEDDGTIVENEEYFDTLQDQTVFLLVRDNERYAKPWDQDVDETDYVCAAGATDVTPTNLHDVTRRLRHDLTQLVTLDMYQLQVLIDAEADELCSLLNCSKQETVTLQEACQRYVDEKRDTVDAIEAIRLFAEHPVEHTQAVQAKRKKTS